MAKDQEKSATNKLGAHEAHLFARIPKKLKVRVKKYAEIMDMTIQEITQEALESYLPKED